MKIYRGGASDTSAAVDDDFDPDEPLEAKAKYGDIYQLGQHRLMCGDSTNIDDVEKLFSDEKADITLTSPPYGAGENAHLRKKLKAGYSGRDGTTFYGKETDSKFDFPELMTDFFSVAQIFTKAQFINVMMIGDNKSALVDFIYANRESLVDVIVWNKHTCPPQIHENVLNNGYEFVFIFDNENGSRKIRFGDFKGTQSNYLETARQQNEYADIHKAVFSTEFVDKILEMNGKATSVYEPFCGTGTTMIVCEQRGIKSFCMEKNPLYVDTSIARWEKLTGQKAVLLNE